MKNIHILPTDKPSRLFKNIHSELLSIRKYDDKPLNEATQNQHIYITSDEEIKDGDWVFNFEYIYIVQYDSKKHDSKFWYKKIILTTDQDLIKDGVQAIDDEFLEWFVKNPSCEKVEVEIICGVCGVEGREDEIDVCGRSKECARGWISDKYKIIIPKEEPKQETLEEASKKYALNRKFNMTSHLIGFRKGAKWQAERMYSEEEVHKILGSYSANKEVFSHKYTYDMWFEQFKKK